MSKEIPSEGPQRGNEKYDTVYVVFSSVWVHLRVVIGGQNGASVLRCALRQWRMALQNLLAEGLERGDILKGGGGIRKLRYTLPGRGKHGGVRVIYYWLRNEEQIYMLLIYPKSKKDNLTDRETALLREPIKGL